MSTLRELAAESIGRITRRGLEPQIAQIDGALERRERVIAVAPGHDGSTGIVVAVTDGRILVSRGAPFAEPALEQLARASTPSATAEAQGPTWTLRVEHAGGPITVAGMFDRDAQRLAALLSTSR